jgi:hypothetical protein
MTKPLVNNRITDRNVYGRVIEHDNLFNRGSPTFGNVQIAGNATIEGNLVVEGNAWIQDTNLVVIEDNFIVLNASGGSINRAGLEIERGPTLPNFQIVFDETTDTLLIGTVGSSNGVEPLSPVATYNRDPQQMVDGGIVTWDSATRTMTAVDTIDVTARFTNAISFGSSPTPPQIHTDSHNNLVIETPANKTIIMNTGSMFIPANRRLSFGQFNPDPVGEEPATSIYANQMSAELTISSSGLRLEGAPAIRAATGTLTLDANVIAFGSNATSTQRVSVTNNDLSFSAGNSINFAVGAGHNVGIQSGRGLQLGTAGRFYTNPSDPTDKDVYFTGGSLRFSDTTPLKFGDSTQIYEDVFGDLRLMTPNTVRIPGTTGAADLDSGALVVDGGAAVKKDLWVGNNMYIYGDITRQGGHYTEDTETIYVDRNLIVVNAAVREDIDGGLLIKRPATLSTNYGQKNLYAAVYFRELSDEITFAYTDMDTAANYVTINDYIPLKAAGLSLTSTQNASTTTSRASLKTPGGIIVGKDLIVQGTIISERMNIANIESSTVSIGNLFVTRTAMLVESEDNATNGSTGSFVLRGGAAIGKDLYVNGTSYLTNAQITSTIASTSASSGSLVIKGGVGIEKDLYIGGQIITPGLTITNTSPASRLTRDGGALVLDGGLTILTTQPATSITSGGALLLAGGASVGKNMFVRGQMTLGDDSAGGLRKSITQLNNTTGNTVWYRLADSVSRFHLTVNSNIECLEVFRTDIDIQHARRGYTTTEVDNAESRPAVYIKSSNGQVYLKLPSATKVSLTFISPVVLDVTSVAEPSGTNYNTETRLSNMKMAMGETTIRGNLLLITDTIENVIHYYDTTTERFRIGLGESTSPTTPPDCSVQFGQTVIADTQASTATDTGALVVAGGVAISCSTDATSATSGGALTAAGGVGIEKRLFVGDRLAIGTPAPLPESLIINKNAASMLLQSATSNPSYIKFKEMSSEFEYDITRTANDLFTIRLVGSPSPSITVNTAGNVGIGTNAPNSGLTLANRTLVTNETNSEFIGLLGSTAGGQGGRVLVQADGGVTLESNADAPLAFKSGPSQQTRMEISPSGQVTVTDTVDSTAASSGALVISGGVGILCSTNATTTSGGGALTVAGGAAIAKDLHVGGQIFVSGALDLSTAVASPDITISNTINCSVVSVNNVKTITSGEEVLLSFWVETIPAVASELCEFGFNVPHRTFPFVNRGELMATCSGWTNHTSVHPVFNVVCVGEPNTNRGIVKFQSVSQEAHYFSIIARYSIDEETEGGGGGGGGDILRIGTIQLNWVDESGGSSNTRIANFSVADSDLFTAEDGGMGGALELKYIGDATSTITILCEIPAPSEFTGNFIQAAILDNGSFTRFNAFTVISYEDGINTVSLTYTNIIKNTYIYVQTGNSTVRNVSPLPLTVTVTPE